jgi:hypothetical protein
MKYFTFLHFDKIFDKFDYNGNGILSLAEIDKAVLELYPHFSKNKPVIMRAYKAADISKVRYLKNIFQVLK